MPTIVFWSNGLRVQKIAQIKYMVIVYTIFIMSSWKSYGGIDKFDKTSNVTVNSIVANYFVIRKQITGDIDISGNLIVEKYLNVYNDATFNSDVNITGTINVDNMLNVNGDIVGNGNLYANNVNVANTLFIGNIINNMYLYGDENGIGVNTLTPGASFDISGNHTSSLNVYSSKIYSKNTLVQNVNHKGIVLATNNEVSDIQFFNGNTIGNESDAIIQSDSSGNMILMCDSIVKMVPRLVVSDLSSDTFINDATLSIHNDSSGTNFLYDVYENATIYANNGISAIATDNSSVIFTNMITPENQGMAIGGGRYPNDATRSIGTMGCFDASGAYIPNQIIVSGNSTIKNKTTVGINTYNPKVDTYVVDINGPVHIDNGEITTIAKPTFQITKMAFYKGNSDIGIVIGTPSSFTHTKYSLKAYYTKNGGKTWNDSTIANIDQTNGVVSMKAVWIYDENYILLYGDNGSGYYSYDGGESWVSTSFSNVSDDMTDMYIVDVNETVSRVFMISKSIESEYKMYYFDAMIGKGNNSDYVAYNTSSVIIANTESKTYYNTFATEKVFSIAGHGSHIYTAGKGVIKYDLDMIQQGSTYNSDGSYKNIFAYDNNYIIAVGDNIVSYTNTGFTDLSNIEIEGYLRNVSILDPYNAIAVGDNGLIMYSTDGSLTWKKISNGLLNPSGTKTMLDGSLNDVFIYDINSFIISNNMEDYYYDNSRNNYHGSSKILYNYLPNVMNSANNNVLDVSGNMTISGNIAIDNSMYGSGAINTNGNKFYLLHDNANTIYFGTDASDIQIGSVDVGRTLFNHSVDISGNLYISGFLTALGTNTTITSVKSLYIDWENNGSADYALEVNGTNADAKLSGNVNVGGNFEVLSTSNIVNDSSGAFYVAGSSKFMKKIVVKDSANASYDSSGAFYVAGGGYFGGNIVAAAHDVSGSLQVYGGSTFDGSVNMVKGQMNISGNITASRNNDTNGSFYISAGDAKMNGNVFAMQNVYIGGLSSGYALHIGSGTSYFDGNVSISGTGTISGGTWSSSDYRIKSNVENLYNTDYSVDHLRPVYYYNEQAKRNQMGFIAHEVSEHFPFLVNGEKDGEEYQSIHYSGFIALLVREIQSLKDRVRDLECR